MVSGLPEEGGHVANRFGKEELSIGGCVASRVGRACPEVQIRGADFEGEGNGKGNCDLSSARHG